MMLDFDKQNGLVPVIIQDAASLRVLMLGYMNEAALEKTKAERKVTFYSRTKQRLWTKGESSGHFLYVKEIRNDCDKDTLLILCEPQGPTCHTGSVSCFGKDTKASFLHQLEQVVAERAKALPEESYTAGLLEKGINKVAQKVGEEAVEVVIEAKDDNEDLFANEVADLLYHLLVLLQAKKITLSQIEEVLQARHQ